MGTELSIGGSGQDQVLLCRAQGKMQMQLKVLKCKAFSFLLCSLSIHFYF